MYNMRLSQNFSFWDWLLLHLAGKDLLVLAFEGIMPVCADDACPLPHVQPQAVPPGVFFVRPQGEHLRFLWDTARKDGTMERIAVIGAILEKPQESQQDFNNLISQYRGLIKGRMGIPFDEEDTAVIALTLRGELDDINALTGKLGNLPHVTVKTAVSVRGTDAKSAAAGGRP
jgi:putative iron-only hydrogenase system regulator